MDGIRAIFFDIDGTLVSFRTHRIPQTTLDAVRRVRTMGVKVFIATGRPVPFVNNLGDMEYDGIVAVNGGSVVTADGEVILRRTIDPADLQRLIAYEREHPMPIAFASDREAFVTKLNDEAREVFTLLDLNEKSGVFAPIEHCLEMETMQVIPFFHADEEPYIMEHVLQGCDAFRWHPSFVDAICKGNNKATGIDAMLAHFGIPLEQTMAFGDGGNDIEMLRHVPHSVAMGNASDAVKAAARYVTDSVDDDGIANILRQLI
ncbi:MAG: Cof-type HAD-IIB family hydrolase [Bacteroidaceae bacterium]|nr:Cof-type HAD-IIB family hydrolase [Bacteroidaceae bacterium]